MPNRASIRSVSLIHVLMQKGGPHVMNLCILESSLSETDVRMMPYSTRGGQGQMMLLACVSCYCGLFVSKSHPTGPTFDPADPS
jgi:hypothetical protein